MKRRKRQKQNPILVIALSAVLFALCVLLFLLMRTVISGKEIGTGSCKPAPDAGKIAVMTPAPTLLDLYAYFDWVETTTIKVYDHRADKLVDMDLEEYIVGVVSAEMPAYYDFEALKAQAGK